MKLLRIIFWIIIGAEICTGIWNLLKIFLVNKKLDDFRMHQNFTNAKIIIVIPCLREQTIIENTIDYFLNLIKHFKNIELVIVTTEKEEYERKINQNMGATTSEIVREYIKNNNPHKLIHLHYPKKDGIMADQLNYVLEKYQKENFNNTYFSVYNADSRPNFNTIIKVLKTIETENYPSVMQQYSFAFTNLNTLSFIMKGFALYQSNFEIKYGLINSMMASKLLYTYVVGHGLYIRLDLLKELGGFDNKFWCEDIYLSSVLRHKNINISPIITLENMETPKNISVLMKQNANWFKTSSQLIKMIKINLKKIKKFLFLP